MKYILILSLKDACFLPCLLFDKTGQTFPISPDGNIALMSKTDFQWNSGLLD